MILPIVKYPNDILRKKAEVVTAEEFKSGELVMLVCQMIEAMTFGNGIGLAAPQVGISKRIIVMNTQNLKSGFSGVLVNPKIVHQSKNTSPLEEGCLSFPGKTVSVDRPNIVTVAYQDVYGHDMVNVFQGIAAKCIQHEIDHLDGKLLVDYEGEKT